MPFIQHIWGCIFPHTSQGDTMTQSNNMKHNHREASPQVQTKATTLKLFLWLCLFLLIGGTTQAQAGETNYIYLPIVTHNNFFSCETQTQIPQAECDALLLIYETAQLEPWQTAPTPCTWEGITCDNGHVVGFQLSETDITTLPSEINNLTNLEELDLSFNQITVLPAELWSLTNLHALDLGGNPLGMLPAEIGNLTNLQELYIHTNQLNEIPVEVGNLTNLHLFDLSHNQLNELPTIVGNLSNLHVLVLDGNPLTSLSNELCTMLENVSISPSTLCPEQPVN